MADVELLLTCGADKISVNTAAYNRPDLIKDLSDRVGSQAVVLAIDTKKEADGEWYVYLHGGRTKPATKAMDWAKQAIALGAGAVSYTHLDVYKRQGYG